MTEKKTKASEIGRCEGCGKMVVFTKYTLCYECRQEEKAQVDKAMAYLKTHRGATLNFVAEATGVDPKIILRLIRGGRLEAKPEVPNSSNTKKKH